MNICDFYHTCFGWHHWGCKCPVYLCSEFSRDSFQWTGARQHPAMSSTVHTQWTLTSTLTSIHQKSRGVLERVLKIESITIGLPHKTLVSSAAVSYNLDYWCSWDDTVYLCVKISFHPHLSHHLVNEGLTDWHWRIFKVFISIFDGKGFTEIEYLFDTET